MDRNREIDLTVLSAKLNQSSMRPTTTYSPLVQGTPICSALGTFRRQITKVGCLTRRSGQIELSEMLRGNRSTDDMRWISAYKATYLDVSRCDHGQI